jgi:hypothetical protein
MTPTEIQYLYLINIALLHGAKGIDTMNYFETDIVEGMYNSNTNEHKTLFYYTKNFIALRLQGLFGKTLKILTQ